MSKEVDPFDHHYLENASPGERMEDENNDRISAFRRLESICPEIARVFRETDARVDDPSDIEAIAKFLEADPGSKKESSQLSIVSESFPGLAEQLKEAKNSLERPVPGEAVSDLDDFLDECRRLGIHTVPPSRN